MYAHLTKTSQFKLFQQIEHIIRLSSDLQSMLRKVAELVGWQFELDRCVVMLFDCNLQEIYLTAQFHNVEIAPLPEVRYQLRLNSEWCKLLSEGKPLPLKDIGMQKNVLSALPEFDQFINDSESQSLIAFPLVNAGQLIGVFSMHYLREANGFSEELLEFGEFLAEELAEGIGQISQREDRNEESELFREAQIPMLVMDSAFCKILKANRSACRLLEETGKKIAKSKLLDFVPNSDAMRLTESFQRLSSGQSGAIRLNDLVLQTANGAPVKLDACLSVVQPASDKLLVILLPSLPLPTELEAGEAVHGDKKSKVDELVSALSKQLQWERIARNIISSLSSIYDRDAILQTALDSLGRVLGVSRGLIVKTEAVAIPTVTHEFAVPDISPLGLGRTSQFPAQAVAYFKNKSAAFADLSKQPDSPELSGHDFRSLVDKGVYSMAGCPITHHGQYHGLILVMQSDSPREWQAHERELIELVSDHVAIALSRAYSYTQIKDQLFNMNLIGNLAQQLTNALDQIIRAGKTTNASEAGKPSNSVPPLSPRELEVLKLIASGLPNREIAQQLFLTESTVELHASRIRKKLKLKSRTALVKYACDNHLV